MVESFILQYNVIKEITPVKITSAVKLDAGLVQSMVNHLKKKEHLKEVELEEVIDTDMIGGFILQYGDKMIDLVPDVDGYSLYGDVGSSDFQIENFRKSLKNNRR